MTKLKPTGKNSQCVCIKNGLIQGDYSDLLMSIDNIQIYGALL